MNRLLVQLLRRVLLYVLEKYIEGLSDACIKSTPASDSDWVPAEIEVVGDLRLKPDLLRPTVCVDAPAAVEVAQGGAIGRVVVRLPTWLRRALAQCLSWDPGGVFGGGGGSGGGSGSVVMGRSSSRAGGAASSEDAAAERAQANTLLHAHFPRDGPAKLGREALPPIVPPLPLHLPAKPGSEQRPQSAEVPILDCVVVELHGLQANLRTYSAEELGELRRETADEALKRLSSSGSPGAGAGGSGGASAAAAGGGGAAAEVRQGGSAKRDFSSALASWMPAHTEVLTSLLESIHERFRIECHGADVRLSTEAGDSARVVAKRIEVVSCYRQARDRDEEAWFGGDRAPNGKTRTTLEVRMSDVQGCCRSPAPDVRLSEPREEEEEFALTVPTFLVVGVSHPTPDDVASGEAGEGRSGWRFAAPQGARLALLQGVGGLGPLCGVVNAICQAVAACDPCTLASTNMEDHLPENRGFWCEPGDFRALWWREWRRLRAPQGEASPKSSGPLGSMMCGAGSGSACGGGLNRDALELTDEERRRLRRLQGKLPLVVQAASLLSQDDDPVADMRQASFAKLQRALCHAFCGLWPANFMEIAVELGGQVQIDIGDHAPRAARSRSVSLVDPAAAAAVAAAGGAAGRMRLTVCSRAAGLYISQLARPYDWRKSTRLVFDGLTISDTVTGQEVLSCAPEVAAAHAPAAAAAHASSSSASSSSASASGGASVPAAEQFDSGVALFRALVEAPAIAVELSNGIFAPRGLSGPPPWPVKCEQFENDLSFEAQEQTPRFECGGSSASTADGIYLKEVTPDVGTVFPERGMPLLDGLLPGGGGGSWGSEVEQQRRQQQQPGQQPPPGTRLAALQPWLGVPEQPKRSLFVRIALSSRLHVTVRPALLPELQALQMQAAEPRLGFDLGFECAIYPEPPVISARVSLASLEVKVREDGESAMALAAELRDGASLDVEPSCNGTGIDASLVVNWVGMRCTSSTGEVRPVLSIPQPFSIAVQKRSPRSQQEQETSVTVEPGGSRCTSRVVISPQLCLVAMSLVEQFTEAAQLCEQPPKADVVSSESAAAASGAAEEGFEDDPDEQEASRRVHVRLAAGTLSVDLSDAVSALLRIRLALHARVAATLGDAGVERLRAVAIVTGVKGQFASQRAGVWEPFLEPWGLGLHVDSVKDSGTQVSVADYLCCDDTAGIWRTVDNMFGVGEPRMALSSNACPLLLNLTPQLLRVALCVSNQLQEHMTVKEERPLLQTTTSNINLGANTQARIASLNLTGCSAAFWLHHGSSLTKARCRAVSTHWTAAAPEENPLPPPGVVLPARAPADGQCAPTALDHLITVPSKTAVALQLHRVGEEGGEQLGRLAPWLVDPGVYRSYTEAVSENDPDHELSDDEDLEEGHNEESGVSSLRPAPTSPGTGSGASGAAARSAAARSPSPRGGGGGGGDGFASPALASTDPSFSVLGFGGSAALAQSPSPSVGGGGSRGWRARWADLENQAVCVRSECGESPSRPLSVWSDCADMEGADLFMQHSVHSWPRLDNFPVLPLTVGWCVSITAATSTPITHHHSQQHDLPVLGWWRSEFVVQVLAPQPATRLLFVASPFRIFNYTDRDLRLAFQLSEDRPMAFSADSRVTATIPAALLGAAQPIDVDALTLPPSPVGDESCRFGMDMQGSTGEETLESWLLPRNSLCCVPLALRSEGASELLCFRVASCGAPEAAAQRSPWAWSQWVQPSQMPDREWLLCCCEDKHTKMFFRIAAIRQVFEEPCPVEVLNIVILPAFSVANVTPTSVSAEVSEDTERHGRGILQRVSGALRCRGRRDREEDEETEPGGPNTPVVEPGQAVHLYSVNSLHPIRLRLRLLAEAQDQCDDSGWSSVIHNVCRTCASKAARVDVPFKPPYRSPTVEVMCVDFVAAISCPFWLANQSSLNLYVGRRRERFPVVRGIAMLDAQLSDVKVYLEELPWTNASADAKTCMAQLEPKHLITSTTTVSPNQRIASVASELPKQQVSSMRTASSHSETCKQTTTSTSGELPNVQPMATGACRKDSVVPMAAGTCQKNSSGASPTSSGMLPSMFNSLSSANLSLCDFGMGHVLSTCAFPVPVASRVAQGMLRTPSGGCVFAVTRDALPSPLGELAAPTTCFRIIPSVMISNRTSEKILIRQVDREDTHLHIAAGESAPYWAVGSHKGLRRIQFQFADSHAEDWSASIPCDVAANGRFALAMLRSQRRRVGHRCASGEGEGNIADLCADEQQTQTLSVEVSDEVDGIVSVTLSEELCLVVGCFSKLVASVTVRTDLPSQHRSTGSGAHQWADVARAGVRDAAALARAGASSGMSFARDAGAGLASKMQEIIKTVAPNAPLPKSPTLSSATPRRASERERDTQTGFSYAFGGERHRREWPLAVGWYQPFPSTDSSAEKGRYSLSFHLRWRDNSPFLAAGGLWVTMSLARLTPLIVLRPLNLKNLNKGAVKPTGAILRLRPRAEQEMRRHAQKMFRNADIDDSAEACGREWMELSKNSPDLIEVLDAHIETLDDVEVEWMCGACGKLCLPLDGEDFPQICNSCNAMFSRLTRSSSLLGRHGGGLDLLLQANARKFVARGLEEPPCVVQGRTSAAATIGTPSHTAAFSLQLSSVALSVVSERLRQELFFARLDDIDIDFHNLRGFERGRISLQGCRVDCQWRVAQQNATSQESWLDICRQSLHASRFFRHLLRGSARLNRCLRETPALFAATGPVRRLHLQRQNSAAGGGGGGGGGDADAASVGSFWSSGSDAETGRWEETVCNSARGALKPCMEVDWVRPVLGAGGNAVCLKSFDIAFNQRWELMVDDIAAGALLSLNAEIASAVSSSTGKERAVVEARRTFEEVLSSAQDGFVLTFVPPATPKVIQVEKAHISGFEVAVWFCIELTRLPTSMMPASLMFLLKVLSGSFAENLSIDGSTLIFKEWPVPEVRWSAGQLASVIQAKYQTSVIFFLARALGSSNLLALPRMLLPNLLIQQVANICADLVDVIDFSAFTMDSDYVQQRKEKNKREDVDSLQEGVEVAGECLVSGVFGMLDVVEKPRKHWRERGIRGVPAGCCRGLLSCFFKPLDAVFRALHALIRGISAAAVGRCRRRHRRRRATPPRQRRSGGRKHQEGPPSASGSGGGGGGLGMASGHCGALGDEGRGVDGGVGSPRDAAVEGSLAAAARAAAAAEAPQGDELMGARPSGSSMSARKPASGHLEPALRGEAALRLPRLLFGEGAAVKAFLPWHAELLRCLGAQRADGICAAWRLAGCETGPVHIVLCVSREHLLLVDLNRRKEKATRHLSFRTKAGLKIDKHMHASLQVMMRTASKLKRQQQQLRRKSSRRHTRLAVGKKSTVMPLRSLYSSQWSQLSLSLPSGRMLRPGMFTASLLKRARELPGGTWQLCARCRRGEWWRIEGEPAEEVLAAWSWSELRGIEARGGKIANWTLCITAASGIDADEEHMTEWPLLGEVVPAPELHAACRGVRKAMLELGHRLDSGG